MKVSVYWPAHRIFLVFHLLNEIIHFQSNFVRFIVLVYLRSYALSHKGRQAGFFLSLSNEENVISLLVESFMFSIL